MEQFEELIEKLKPIYANQIDYYYVEKFAISVLKLLIKLGIKEGWKSRQRPILAVFTSISKTKSKTKYKNLHQMQVHSHHMQDLHMVQAFSK